MKVIRASELKFVPASHEDPGEPGVLKKVLLRQNDFIRGHIQMINRALLPAGRSFRPHYHEDMQEVFIICTGHARIRVDEEETQIGAGDAVVIPVGGVHEMENIGKEDVEYVVVGVSKGERGKTVVV